MYEDQYDDFYHHYGVGNKNVDVWLPKLEGAINAINAKLEMLKMKSDANTEKANMQDNMPKALIRDNTTIKDY